MTNQFRIRELEQKVKRLESGKLLKVADRICFLLMAVDAAGFVCFLLFVLYLVVVA